MFKRDNAKQLAAENFMKNGHTQSHLYFAIVHFFDT